MYNTRCNNHVKLCVKSYFILQWVEVFFSIFETTDIPCVHVLIDALL